MTSSPPRAALPIITTEHLSRTFGQLVAVRDVSLQIMPGEIFGVLGPNGAGKSTTIRMLCGILDPTGGTGRVVGFDIATQTEQIKQRIGYMTQRFSLYEDLTIEENLTFFAGIYGVPYTKRRARVAAAMQQGGLTERRKQIAGTLSGGWKQRVALASATIHEPPLLFLDEPTAGVDPVSRREFWEQIHVLAEQGTTVLLTTHYMDEAERCHRLAFIFRGEVLAVGTPTEVVERRDLHAVEFELEGGTAMVEKLRAHPGVDQVTRFGYVTRVVTRPGADPNQVLADVFGDGPSTRNPRVSRVTVEDAFISMVNAQFTAPPLNTAAEVRA